MNHWELHADSLGLLRLIPNSPYALHLPRIHSVKREACCSMCFFKHEFNITIYADVASNNSDSQNLIGLLILVSHICWQQFLRSRRGEWHSSSAFATQGSLIWCARNVSGGCRIMTLFTMINLSQRTSLKWRREECSLSLSGVQL